MGPANKRGRGAAAPGGEESGMFENLGFGELLVILIIALVIFGPGKLPELGRSLGKAIREFKSAVRDVQAEIARAASDESSQGERQ